MPIMLLRWTSLGAGHELRSLGLGDSNWFVLIFSRGRNLLDG